jgi:hypothetical protein
MPLAISLLARAHAAHEVDDGSDQEDEAKGTSAESGTAKVESAAAKYDEQDQDEEYRVHGCNVPFLRTGS